MIVKINGSEVIEEIKRVEDMLKEASGILYRLANLSVEIEDEKA